MEALQINVHLDKDEHNNPPTLETQVLNTALSRLIAINKDFTRLHAIAAISEIESLWPDLSKPDFTAYQLYILAQVLRQADIVVEQAHLRAFLVAWRVFNVSIPSMDATGHAELARDMVVSQFGCVEKEVTTNDHEKTITPRAKMDIDEDKENTQTLSPGSPFKLHFKTQKKWPHQRQLNTLILKTKKLEKRKRGVEDEHDGPVAHLDDDDSEVRMEPILLSTAEKEALTLEKLERKRKLEALGSKQKRRRHY